MSKFQSVERVVTRLSGARPRRPRTRGLLWLLARLSLGAVSASMLSGCLIEDPPPYAKPQQTPPRLNYKGAIPLLDQVIVTRTNETIPFSIPVTSEDAGEGLTAYLLLDYVIGQPIEIVDQPSNLPPSTIDSNEERVFRFNWRVSKLLPPGCYRLTLLAGHTSTFSQLSNIEDTDDLTEAYWWANVDLTPENAGILRDCPDPSRPGVSQ